MPARDGCNVHTGFYHTGLDLETDALLRFRILVAHEGLRHLAGKWHNEDVEEIDLENEAGSEARSPITASHQCRVEGKVDGETCA